MPKLYPVLGNKSKLWILGIKYSTRFLKIPTEPVTSRKYSMSSFGNQTSDAPMFCLNDYDVIGFDLDHTLCKYRLRAISQLIYNNMCKYLTTVNKYPSNIFGSYEESAKFYQRGLVIHLEKGNFLKLAEDFTILRATHGTKVLTPKEIEKIYGAAKIWEPTKNMLRELCDRKTELQPYRSLQDFFVIPAPYICAKIIDYLDTTESTRDYTFWYEVYESISDMYKRECFHENKGGYFPALRENLPAYAEKCTPEFLEWLKSLKKHKKLYLLTGSHYDYAKFILDYIIGEDWSNYFDICITYARKPKFFYETSTNQPFIQLNGFVETTPISGEELQESSVYSQGNWTELNKFFCKACNKSEINALYFGDVIIDDVYGGSHFSCCDTISILEEMAAEGIAGKDASHDSIEELYSDTWGSFFVDGKKDSKLTIWASAVMKYGRLAIPDLKSLSALALTQKVPSFTFLSSSNRNGFYPALPNVLITNNVNSKI